jgi:hypothetical protein
MENTKETHASEIKMEMIGWRRKLDEIEEKNKCLRVQFLDWLSDRLLNWSNRCHELSMRIHSPCLIKVQPRKREDSQHAKDSREIKRLRESLDQVNKKNIELLQGYVKMQTKEETKQ